MSHPGGGLKAWDRPGCPGITAQWGLEGDHHVVSGYQALGTEPWKWVHQVSADQVMRELSIPKFYWDHPSALARSPSTAGSLSTEAVDSSVTVVDDACEPTPSTSCTLKICPEVLTYSRFLQGRTDQCSRPCRNVWNSECLTMGVCCRQGRCRGARNCCAHRVGRVQDPRLRAYLQDYDKASVHI